MFSGTFATASDAKVLTLDMIIYLAAERKNLSMLTVKFHDWLIGFEINYFNNELQLQRLINFDSFVLKSSILFGERNGND